MLLPLLKQLPFLFLSVMILSVPHPCFFSTSASLFIIFILPIHSAQQSHSIFISLSSFDAENSLKDIYAEGIVSNDASVNGTVVYSRYQNQLEYWISSGAFFLHHTIPSAHSTSSSLPPSSSSPRRVSSVCLRVYLKTGYYIRF